MRPDDSVGTSPDASPPSNAKCLPADASSPSLSAAAAKAAAAAAAGAVAAAVAAAGAPVGSLSSQEIAIIPAPADERVIESGGKHLDNRTTSAKTSLRTKGKVKGFDTSSSSSHSSSFSASETSILAVAVSQSSSSYVSPSSSSPGISSSTPTIGPASSTPVGTSSENPDTFASPVVRASTKASTIGAESGAGKDSSVTLLAKSSSCTYSEHNLDAVSEGSTSIADSATPLSNSSNDTVPAPDSETPTKEAASSPTTSPSTSPFSSFTSSSLACSSCQKQHKSPRFEYTKPTKPGHAPSGRNPRTPEHRARPIPQTPEQRAAEEGARAAVRAARARAVQKQIASGPREFDVRALVPSTKLLSLFLDFPEPQCLFSLHNLIRAGRVFEKQIGEWYGPSEASLMLKRCAEAALPGKDSERSAVPVVVIADNSTLYLDQVLAQCCGKPKHEPLTGQDPQHDSASSALDGDRVVAPKQGFPRSLAYLSLRRSSRSLYSALAGSAQSTGEKLSSASQVLPDRVQVPKEGAQGETGQAENCDGRQRSGGEIIGVPADNEGAVDDAQPQVDGDQQDPDGRKQLQPSQSHVHSQSEKIAGPQQSEVSQQGVSGPIEERKTAKSTRDRETGVDRAENKLKPSVPSTQSCIESQQIGESLNQCTERLFSKEDQMDDGTDRKYHGPENATAAASEDESKPAWSFDDPAWRSNFKPVLLLVPVRLGVTHIHKQYLNALLKCFRWPQSVGAMGGKPRRSLYFFGVQGTRLLFLDPHTVQYNPENFSATQDSPDHSVWQSFHPQTIHVLEATALDPSLTLAFYCRSPEDFEDFWRRAKKLSEGKLASAFQVAEKMPTMTYNGDLGGDLNDEGHLSDGDVSREEEDFILL
eukprot:g2273.t1